MIKSPSKILHEEEADNDKSKPKLLNKSSSSNLPKPFESLMKSKITLAITHLVKKEEIKFFKEKEKELKE